MCILCCESFDANKLFTEFKNKLYTDVKNLIEKQPENEHTCKKLRLAEIIERLKPYTLQVKTIRVPHIIEKHPELEQYNELHVLTLDKGNKKLL